MPLFSKKSQDDEIDYKAEFEKKEHTATVHAQRNDIYEKALRDIALVGGSGDPEAFGLAQIAEAALEEARQVA